MSERKKQVAIYVRVSSAGQQGGSSLQRQALELAKPVKESKED